MEDKSNYPKNGSVAKQDPLINTKKVPGESVDKLRDLEDANIMLTGDEIKQQNENM